MFHRHKWEEIDRGFYKVENRIPDGHAGGFPAVTLITFQCHCGMFNQVQLKGRVKGSGVFKLPDKRM